ncbi:MAG: hypothetical protein LH650_01055 [Chloroflexi bacterium]|nr:hypothetical protein [Chloroflexota bacterium]
MGRTVWLTWKMHRFEVIAVVALMALFAVSACIVTSHINGIGLSGACWPRTEDGNYATPGCDQLMNQYWMIRGSEGTWIRIGLAVLAPLVGLIVGVPLVARELELRTTALAWSLQGVRWRWLLSRLLPMTLIALGGLVLLGIAGSAFFDSLRTARDEPALTEVASSGVALVARGLMALAIAVLVGAIVGRTMPAFIVAAVVVVVVSAVGVGLIQSELSRQFAVWIPMNLGSWKDGENPLAYLDSGLFDSTKPGVDGQPGVPYTYDDLSLEIDSTCGPSPVDDTGDSPATLAYNACVDPIVNRGNDDEWSRAVPASRYGDYVAADIALSLLIGGLAVLLTFPIVTRRRPSCPPAPRGSPSRCIGSRWWPPLSWRRCWAAVPGSSRRISTASWSGRSAGRNGKALAGTSTRVRDSSRPGSTSMSMRPAS